MCPVRVANLSMVPKGIEKAVKTALREKRWAQARELCWEALEQDPQRLEFREHLAECEQYLQRYHQCLSLCDALLAEPNAKHTPKTRLLRARALAALDRMPQALDAYRELVAHHPDFPKGLMDAATFFQRADCFQEGIACLDLFQKVAPGLYAKTPSATFKQSWFKQQMGDLRGALRTLAPLLPQAAKEQYDANEANALLAAGRVELRQGHFLNAQRYFHQALHSPLSPAALRALASFWLMHTNPAAARDYFRQLWRLTKSPESYSHIVDCYVNETDLPTAARLFNTALLRTLAQDNVDGDWLARLCTVYREEFGSRSLVSSRLGDESLALFDTAVAATFQIARRQAEEASTKIGLLSPPIQNPEAFVRGANMSPQRSSCAICAVLKSIRAENPGYDSEDIDVHFVATLAMGGLERRLARNVLAQTSRRQLICVLRTDHPDRDTLVRMVADNVAVVELSLYATRDDLNLQSQFPARPGLSEISQLAACASFIREIRPARIFVWGVQTFETVASAAYIARAPEVIVHDGSVAPVQRTLMTPAQLGRFQYVGDLLRQFLEEPGWRVVCNAPRNVEGYRAFVGGDIPSERFRSCAMLYPREILEQKSEDPAALREKLGIPAAAPVVAFFGRLSKEKNLALWLDAAKLIATERKDAVFLIVGDGQGYFQLRRRARMLGIGRQCRFAGRQNLALKSYYGIADVYLSTSDYEGLPNVLLEAQALGVPVVARAAGGTADAFSPGETGVLVQGKNPVDFAAAVLRLIDNPLLRRRMAEQGPVFIRTHTRETNFDLSS
jgi:glycosyltransferase involved in cell wall biosynthesis